MTNERTRLALTSDYAILLAKLVNYRGLRPTLDTESRIRETRALLFKHHRGNDRTDPLGVMFESLDHMYRVVMMRQGNWGEGAPFSVKACADADVEYYRVVIDEQGEIRNDSGKLTNPTHAISVAEDWYYLVAGTGMTVTLMAILDSGQIIKCGSRTVIAWRDSP